MVLCWVPESLPSSVRFSRYNASLDQPTVWLVGDVYPDNLTALYLGRDVSGRHENRASIEALERLSASDRVGLSSAALAAVPQTQSIGPLVTSMPGTASVTSITFYTTVFDDDPTAAIVSATSCFDNYFNGAFDKSPYLYASVTDYVGTTTVATQSSCDSAAVEFVLTNVVQVRWCRVVVAAVVRHSFVWAMTKCWGLPVLGSA